MRVALVQELGGIDSVELQERPDPTPVAGQALVKVGGAGVGPWDVGDNQRRLRTACPALHPGV
jgi:NADPH:quinone reductase